MYAYRPYVLRSIPRFQVSSAVPIGEISPSRYSIIRGKSVKNRSVFWSGRTADARIVSFSEIGSPFSTMFRTVLNTFCRSCTKTFPLSGSSPTASRLSFLTPRSASIWAITFWRFPLVIFFPECQRVKIARRNGSFWSQSSRFFAPPTRRWSKTRR